jgi:hypothetical protein
VATLTNLESKLEAAEMREGPIQQRHLQEVLDGSLKLAADEDPDEEAS